MQYVNIVKDPDHNTVEFFHSNLLLKLCVGTKDNFLIPF